MWHPPRPGLEPVSPALAGRLSTAAPPGKPQWYTFYHVYYYFPNTAGTYCHKLSGVNNTNLLSYSSIIQKPKMGLPGLKSRCQQSYVPFWRLLGRIHFIACSRFWKLPAFLVSMALFVHLQNQQLQVQSFPRHLSLWSLFCFHLSLVRTPVITLDHLDNPG